MGRPFAEEYMKYLKPESKFSAVSPFETPNVSVIFDRNTIEQAKYLVQNVSTECQWFHRVTRTEDKNGIVFTIHDICVPEQEVSAAFVESSDSEMNAMSDEIMERLGGEDVVLESDELIEEFNTLTNTFSVWCHSHVNMNPSPSGTDRTEFKERIENAQKAGVVQPQVMFILNKKGDYTCHVYDMESGWMFRNPDIVICNNDIDFSYVDTAIKDKLREKKKTFIKPDSKFSGYFATSGYSNVSRKGGPPQGNFLADTREELSATIWDGQVDGQVKSSPDDEEMTIDQLIQIPYQTAHEFVSLEEKLANTAYSVDREAIAEQMSQTISEIPGSIEVLSFVNTFVFGQNWAAESLTWEDLKTGTEADLEDLADNMKNFYFEPVMLLDILDDALLWVESEELFNMDIDSVRETYLGVGA